MAFATLFTLLDDITTLLDDIAGMTKVAAAKTAGVVGDDLALNAKQVIGTPAERELPVVWSVAKGSLINKAVIVPAAIALSALLPALIGPLLTLGGLYLCFEGAQKILPHPPAQKAGGGSEQEKIRGAIRTDFILSAEIIVIALGIVADADLVTRIATLVLVGLAMTVLVYGLVAAIVKLDDLGLYLARKSGFASTLGRGILYAAPWLMRALGVLGTAAMFVVGGQILLHGIPPLHRLAEPWMHGLPGAALAMALGFVCGLAAALAAKGAILAARRLRRGFLS